MDDIGRINVICVVYECDSPDRWLSKTLVKY